MRRRTLASLGGGAAAAAAVGTLVTSGVVAGTLAILSAPRLAAPASAAEGLAPFDSCEALREWYVEAALPSVGPWGLGWTGSLAADLPWPATDVMPWAGAFAADGAVRAAESTTAGSDTAVANSDTGTNVQEAGVDEPDVAKTDGKRVAAIRGRDVVITDVSGARPREVSRVRLPRRLSNPELLLVDDRVVVFGSDYDHWRGPFFDAEPGAAGRMIAPAPYGASRTVVVSIDLAAPEAPRVVRTDRIEGALVSAREYAGVVRAVVTSRTPVIDFVGPNARRSPREATLENRRILRETTIEDWLPTVRTGQAGRTGAAAPLLDCDDVRHPKRPSGFGTISVVTFAADAPDARRTTAVTAAGDLVYSSADRLYVATVQGGWNEPWAAPAVPRRRAAPSTEVHAFALDGLETDYVASGQVPGTVRDRWSLSEYDGRLRVATALGRDPWDPDENAITVLEEDGGRLLEVGRAAGMGRHEQIQSVRWLGDLAVLVTFRQVDPLYTVDLADPRRPRVLGALKIPGFSAYLHPLGDDLLLGLGQHATRRGVTLGAQGAVFDIGDLRSPRRLGTAGFGRHTELGAALDSRAFTYLPQRRVALTPLENYWSGRTRLAILEIGEDGAVSARTTSQVARWGAATVRALPLDDGRVALVADGEVRLLRLG